MITSAVITAIKIEFLIPESRIIPMIPPPLLMYVSQQCIEYEANIIRIGVTDNLKRIFTKNMEKESA
jgi:hypothetical protein